jgi:hypothetical protein
LFTYKKAKRNEPLIDYSYSRVVTFSKYLNIPKEKTMDIKVIIREMREEM